MRCPMCRVLVGAHDVRCPACGHVLPTVEAQPTIIEGIVVSVTDVPGTAREPSSKSAAMSEMNGTPADSRALVPGQPDHPVLRSLSRLPARAWQQPAVRSAVKTGASAVALTVALRLAGRIASSRGARQMARDTLLPALGDLLSSGANGETITRRGPRGERTETFIYIRRTVRW